ncbi:MAG TPA: DUF169 domain-containing protein [Candidatus Anoxymicrobiaceae bacterium]
MEWQDQAKQLSDFLRLMVRPVGVRLLTADEAAEVRAIRPGPDLGRKFTYCQALSIAGRMGLPVMVTGQDEGCIMILQAYGMGNFDPLAKIPESQCAMGWVKDMETAYKFVTQMGEDFLGQRKYAALLASPLESMEQRPDVIFVYGMPAQVVRLVQGYGYVTGEAVESKFTGFGGTCVAGVVRTRRLNKPQVLLPGFGDRMLARVEDHEMAFSFTLDHMDVLLEGIREVGKRSGIPWPFKYAIHDTDFTQLNNIYPEFAEYLERF